VILRLNSTRAATLFALISATLMIAHQVGGKATRDAIFLSHYDVTQLPKLVIVAALISMLAVVVMSRLLAGFGPWRIVPGAFLVSASLFIGTWVLYASHPQVAAITLYLQMAVFGAVLISGFWSVVNERFDPHTAKRTIAEVAAAATLGGVLGGVLADRVAQMIDAQAMIAVLGGLHLICAVTVFSIGRSRTSAGTPMLEVESGIQILFRNRYLLLMGLLMVLVASCAALIDYVFKAEAARRVTDEAALVSLFGRFYAIAGLVTFIVQSMLGPRVLNRFGIGAALSVMPAIIFMAALFNTVFLRLWTVVLLRGAQMVLQNSFFRSAFELLYTPLPPVRKRPTKSIIDVASDRLGDIIGGGIILGLLQLNPNLPHGIVIFAAMVIAILTLVVVKQLYQGYVVQLANNLRDGQISLNYDDIVDATTRQTLAEASAEVERDVLMERISARQRRRQDPSEQPPPQWAGGEAVADPITTAVAALCSGDNKRVRATLEGDFMDARLAGFIVPLLAVEELADLARTELRWITPLAIGALTDALFDPDVPLLARQRLPGVLEVSYHPRSVDALMRSLTDTEFNVRYSAARALSRMSSRDEQLPIDEAKIFEICTAEVSVTRAEWLARDIGFDDPGVGEDLATPVAGTRIDYSLEHVFTLLGLVLDRDALRLSLRAVFSADRDIRGTALEYLENVLPDALRRALWPHLGLRVEAGMPRMPAAGPAQKGKD